MYSYPADSCVLLKHVLNTNRKASSGRYFTKKMQMSSASRVVISYFGTRFISTTLKRRTRYRITPFGRKS